VRKKFEKHKYPDNVKDAFIRYTRALDERNWNIAFLKLWSILELLTDTIGISYETTIKRTSYIYKERDYHLQILEHLRKYRNSSVHFDKDNSEMEIYLYQIKNYVEALIGFYINNRLGFESIQEAASFLNLPYDKEVLNRQIEKIKFASRFHGYS